jgi:hypothetical protein
VYQQWKCSMTTVDCWWPLTAHPDQPEWATGANSRPEQTGRQLPVNSAADSTLPVVPNPYASMATRLNQPTTQRMRTRCNSTGVS